MRAAYIDITTWVGSAAIGAQHYYAKLYMPFCDSEEVRGRMDEEWAKNLSEADGAYGVPYRTGETTSRFLSYKDALEHAIAVFHHRNKSQQVPCEILLCTDPSYFHPAEVLWAKDEVLGKKAQESYLEYELDDDFDKDSEELEEQWLLLLNLELVEYKAPKKKEEEEPEPEPEEEPEERDDLLDRPLEEIEPAATKYPRRPDEILAGQVQMVSGDNEFADNFKGPGPAEGKMRLAFPRDFSSMGDISVPLRVVELNGEYVYPAYYETMYTAVVDIDNPDDPDDHWYLRMGVDGRVNVRYKGCYVYISPQELFAAITQVIDAGREGKTPRDYPVTFYQEDGDDEHSTEDRDDPTNDEHGGRGVDVPGSQEGMAT